MRIIAGIHRGRKLHTPKGMAVRPSTDRLRESLFGFLTPYLPQARILDLFAGTGSLGLEALSRGASFCLFVESSHKVSQILKKNISLLKEEERSQVLTLPVEKLARLSWEETLAFDLVFFDPPYRFYSQKDFFSRLLSWLHPLPFHEQTLWVFEHPKQIGIPSSFEVLRQRNIGDLTWTAVIPPLLASGTS